MSRWESWYAALDDPLNVTQNIRYCSLSSVINLCSWTSFACSFHDVRSMTLLLLAHVFIALIQNQWFIHDSVRPVISLPNSTTNSLSFPTNSKGLQNVNAIIKKWLFNVFFSGFVVNPINEVSYINRLLVLKNNIVKLAYYYSGSAYFKEHVSY